LWNAELRAGLKQWTGVVSWLESCEEGKSGMEEELEKYLARRNEFGGEQSLKSAEIAMRNVHAREKSWSWKRPVMLDCGKVYQDESMDMENTTSHLLITCRTCQRVENIPVSQSTESASSAEKFRS